MDPQHPFATAIAVQNGTVVAVDCDAGCAHEQMKPMVRGKDTDWSRYLPTGTSMAYLR